MHSTYSTLLVLLSYVVAVLASHVTLSLARRLRTLRGAPGPVRPQWAWIAGGAFVMGTGIWSMHIIGMLACQLPIEVAYDARLTTASYVIAVVVSGTALHILSRSEASLRGITVPALLIGAGICVVHYIGMAAMRTAPGITYDPPRFAASALIAIAAAMAALWIAFGLPQDGRRRSWQDPAAAAVMGAAAAGMHFMGMAAARFAPVAVSLSGGPLIDGTWLAIIVAALSTLILVVALLPPVTDARPPILLADLHRAKEAADRAKEAAEAANRAKSQFLAGVSHEIRTPMNAILGLLELLSFTRLDEEQRETVALLRDSSSSLLRLIDDILDFSKIEARRIEIHAEPTRLRDVVEQVTQMFGGVASAKGLILESRVDTAIPEFVCADALRIAQVLGNFLSNAVKFTERGSIRLEVRAEPAAAAPDRVRLAVTDGGIGMDRETIARLCQPFMQGDARTSRRYGGTGLGLAICKRLAVLMGGDLEIDSEPGRGTTIALIVPLPPSAEPDRAAPPPSDARGGVEPAPARAPTVEAASAAGRLILVVDDHPTNRRLLVRQLAWLGLAAEAEASAEEALRRFDERRSAGTPHALVITDCQMPEMDGYELARRLRARQDGGGRRAPILAFTANTLAEAAEECREAGMDDVLTKPIVLAELRAKVERWLPRHAELPAAEHGSAEHAGHTGAAAEDDGIDAEFCAAHEEDLAALLQALHERRRESVTRAAHRMKGAARMYGDEALAGVATHLEGIARGGGDWKALEAAAQAVRSESDRLFARTGWPERRRTA